MGHTLVACFQERELAPLVSVLSKWDGSPSNKIPFGRDCDRDEANQILPYHMTILHWASSNDKIMLPKLKKLALPSLTVIADGVRVLPAGENSSLVYIKIEPTASFEQWCHGQGKALGVCFDTSFLHIAAITQSEYQTVLSIYLRALPLFDEDIKLSLLNKDSAETYNAFIDDFIKKLQKQLSVLLLHGR